MLRYHSLHVCQVLERLHKAGLLDKAPRTLCEVQLLPDKGLSI